MLSAAISPESEFIQGLFLGSYRGVVTVDVQNGCLAGRFPPSHRETLLVLSPFIRDRIAAVHTANGNNHLLL